MAALTVGLIYDLLGSYPRDPADPPDVDAEYEPEATVRVLEDALRLLGHRPLRVGNAHDLLRRLGREESGLDAALTIAEGFGSRNREAWAPVLLEMAGIPALGSDALTLSATLDKLWAGRLVAAAGVPVPTQLPAHSPREAEKVDSTLAFPLFVKPRWEGTAKGVAPSSRVADRRALAGEVERIARDYGQPALIEPFLPGPEYTVTVVGNDPPRALAVLQRALEVTTRIGLHALERHPAPGGTWRHFLPGSLDAALEAELAGLAIRAYGALECRDFARADFRLDGEGRPHFLEMNPLPTFAPDGSFGVLAELEGRPLAELLAEVLDTGLRRLGLP